MASKRRQRRNSCGGKRRYEDKADAINEATRMRRIHPGESYDGYQCPHCGFWHVGHRPKWVSKQINKRKAQRLKEA